MTNEGLQTRVSKPKLAGVNVTQTVCQCLPAVVATFTHSDLGLPTLVCKLFFVVRKGFKDSRLEHTDALYGFLILFGPNVL